MKKFAALLAALSMLAVGCGCSNSSDAESGKDNTQGMTDNGAQGGTAGSTLREDADNVGEDIKQGAEDVGNAVKDGVDDAGNAIREGAEDIGSAMTDEGNTGAKDGTDIASPETTTP